MPRDLRLRRAAGVIMWYRTRNDPTTGALHTESRAVAEASGHEPTLTDDELAYCLDWARCALLYHEMVKNHTKRPKLSRDKDGGLVKDWSETGRDTQTLGHFIDKSGLRAFIE